ncbi:MAG: FAD:protein FMN transferase [Candidatus Peribacteraceae bacterium]|nr:FAD:protein FMN transferase [Candidatus Peribacteraceae bacterium]MDD5742997.1 FAD:protein FMN transferase [Candidatus Peribacteraceae bacterium]
MKDTRLIMGMPITVEIADAGVTPEMLERAFARFVAIDEQFSTFKPASEVSRFNAGAIAAENLSDDLQEVLRLAEETRRQTQGYFDIALPDGRIDPAGLVKGWAIRRVARQLKNGGCRNFCVEAGGDIQPSGVNGAGKPWRVGIRNPFNIEENVKILTIGEHGIATSGTYVRGQHIWNPFRRDQPVTAIVSLTVIGPDVYEADRFATAAFAMGKEGIAFIERLPGFEGYSIDAHGTATMTTHFSEFILHASDTNLSSKEYEYGHSFHQQTPHLSAIPSPPKKGERRVRGTCDAQYFHYNSI